MTDRPSDYTRLVYHYPTKDAALEHILPSMMLRMGEYSKTNDPRESKEWVRMGASKGGPGDFWTGAHAGWDEIERVQQCTRILCLTLDHPDDAHEAPVETRGYGLSRMWAQYASGHTGVCLGLDAALLDQSVRATVPNPEGLLRGHVRYADLSMAYRREDLHAFDIDVNRVEQVGPVQAVREHVRSHADTFFFKKARDWRDEREIRWVYCAEQNDPAFLVPIEGALRQVVVGVNFPRVFLPMVEGICQRVGARLLVLGMYRGHFLDPESDD